MITKFEVADLHHIHCALHDDDINRVTVENRSFPVARANTAGRNFSKVEVEDFLFLTQNLRKGSSNTSWVKEDLEHRNLTWIIHQEYSYLGKILEWIDDDGDAHIEYTLFKPTEHVLYADEDYWAQVETEQSAA